MNIDHKSLLYCVDFIYISFFHFLKKSYPIEVVYKRIQMCTHLYTVYTIVYIYTCVYTSVYVFIQCL